MEIRSIGGIDMQDPVEGWVAELLKQGDSNEKMTEKQSRILRAAIDIFAEKGFNGGSTSEIAQKAGVAEGTIFRHYKTKKDLLLSIVAPVMSKLIAPFVLRDLSRVFDVRYDSVDQFLRAVIMNRLDFLTRNIDIVKIMIQEIPFHPDLQEQFKKIIVAWMIERAKPIVEDFQARGLIRPMPPEQAIRLAASSLIGYVMTRMLYGLQAGDAWDDEAEREETIRFIVRGLMPDS